MNAFTRFRQRRSKDDAFKSFVAYWDRLEQLTIQIFREQIAVGEAAKEFDLVWPWLTRAYGRWQKQLEPFWRSTAAGGQPTKTDPFVLLLDKKGPEEICGDWRAMQHLPAAREAINRYLLRGSSMETSFS